MKILVTGGAGYIGSVIVERLLKQNHEVSVLDNLSKGHKGALSSGANFFEGDLGDRKFIGEILNRNKIEAVIHMAASSLVGESVIDPRQYYENNVVNGLSLLNAMLDGGVRRIVFSSTAATYGEPAKQPIEEKDPTDPTNPYGQSKLAFERALFWYSRAYGIHYVTLRYFNAAGASERCGEDHDPESHIIPAVLQAASGKRPHVEVFGDDYPTRDGTCVRDYIHVIDLAEAHILALSAVGEANFTFNLGCGGNGYSVREVIEVAEKVTGKRIPAKMGPRRPGDPPVLIASSDQIKRILGWQPKYQDLALIIESAWKWMQKFPAGYPS
jgi:UDP-glucose 4-epimerase